MTLPGRLVEVRLSYGVVRLICEIADTPRPEQTVIGVDLGGNTLAAATDGQKVILISGRAAKATIQYRNKRLAGLVQRHSRRYKRLQRRKYRLLGKTKRRIRDLTHKATHAIAAAFPGATCYVGEPFTEAAQRLGRVQAQQVSTTCTRKIIELLDDKTAGGSPSAKPIPRRHVPYAGSGASTAGSTTARTAGRVALVMPSARSTFWRSVNMAPYSRTVPAPAGQVSAPLAQ
jgi:hypothetical protein